MSFIKIERKLVERLTLLIQAVAQRGYDEPYALIRTAYEEGNWKQSVGILFQNLTRDGFNEVRHLEYRTIIDQCTEALTNSSGESHLPQLVNTIVEYLQHPYAQNALAGETLKRLRKAVLFPDELAKVNANAANELKCGGCGKPFVHGEIAIFTNGDRGQPTFCCSRCNPPSYAACGKHGCDGSGVIDPKAMARSLAKTDCGMHQPEKADKPFDIPDEVRRGIIEEGNPGVAAPRWEQVGRPRDPEDVAHVFRVRQGRGIGR